MSIISTDFVPIVPYQIDHQFIGIGQRYDIVVTAQEMFAGQNFWFRASPQLACGDNVISNATAKAIVRYTGSPSNDPTTTELLYPTTCDDPPLSILEPVVPLDVLPVHQQVDVAVTLVVNGSNDVNFDMQGQGFANNMPSSLFLDYNQPTLHVSSSCSKTIVTQSDTCRSSTTDSRPFQISTT